MFKKTVTTLLFSLSLGTALHADKVDPFDLYDWMAALGGEWLLSPAEKQTGTDSYKHKAVMPLLGTDKPGIAFKQIGRNSTVQEDLLPNTAKQMVTMYHCNFDCSQIVATHYCVKMNQPRFIANLEVSTPERIVFECDMSTPLCNSDEDHVHTIIHELTENGTHLKSSYLSLKDKKPVETSSIYHFDRKMPKE